MRKAAGLGRVLAVVLATALVGLASPAAAGPDHVEKVVSAEQLPSGEGELSVGAVRLEMGGGSGGGGQMGGGGGSPGPGPDRAGGMTVSRGLATLYWRDTGRACTLSLDKPGRPGGSVPGRVLEMVQQDPMTVPPTVLVVKQGCFPTSQAPPVVAPPPTPPTLVEIAALARQRIPAPVVAVSPDWGGVTGLESWFWYEGPAQVTASASIRGYSVTATMAPARFYWDPCADYRPPEGKDHAALGCPRLLASARPGSRPADDSNGRAAAARFLYETKGSYEIRHQVVWEGTWRFTGPRGELAAGTLPTIRTTAARPGYVVNEIRGVLVG